MKSILYDTTRLRLAYENRNVIFVKTICLFMTNFVFISLLKLPIELRLVCWYLEALLPLDTGLIPDNHDYDYAR